MLAALQDKALKQLHLNHMGMKNTRLLALESIHWINLNAEIEEMVKNVPPAWNFKQHVLKIRQFHTKYHMVHGNKIYTDKALTTQPGHALD